MRYLFIFIIFISAFIFKISYTNAQSPAFGFGKTYPLNASGSGFTRVLVQNDTIIVLGNSTTNGNPWKISVNKFDTLGNLLSSTMVNDTTNDEYYTVYSSDFITTPDNGYLEVGSINNGIYGNIVRFNHDGTTRWIKKVSKPGYMDWRAFYDMTMYNANKYVSFGFQNTNNGFQNNLWVYFFDDNGNKIRDTVYTRVGTRFQGPHSITAVGPNKILLGAGWGERQTPWILTIDTLGNVLNEWRAPANLGLQECYGIQATPDDGIIFASSKLDSIVNENFYTKGAIVKLNSNYQIDWIKITGESTSNNVFYNGFLNQDGHYIAEGRYWQPFVPDGSEGAVYAWTHKIDLQGNTIWESKDSTLYIPSRNASLNNAWDIKELSSGSLIIVGDATDLRFNRSTAFIIKLSKDGCRDTLWCHGLPVSTAPSRSEGGGEHIKVFPNPVSNVITLTVPTDLVGTTAVMTDLTGRIASTIPLANNQQVIDISQLVAGVYFLTIQNHFDIEPIKVIMLKP
jgi:Secretion system C-terminal sorting domain